MASSFAQSGLLHVSSHNTAAGPTAPIYSDGVGRQNALTTGVFSSSRVDPHTGAPIERYDRTALNERIYGTKQRQPDLDPNEGWANELRDYPEAIANDARGIMGDQTQVIITLLKEADMYPITDLMPLRQSNHRIKIEWEEIKFWDTSMNRLPEEAIGTYMSDTSRRYVQTLQRWGKAASIHRQTYKTPYGKRLWACKMLQAKNALIILAAYSVMVSLMDAELIKKADEVYNDGSEGKHCLMDNFKYDLLTWGIMNKDPKAIWILMSQMEMAYRRQSNNGPAPNRLIVPQGSMKYLAEWAKTRTDFLFTGHPTGTQPNPLISGEPKRYYESIAFRQGDFMVRQTPTHIHTYTHTSNAHCCYDETETSVA